MNTINYTRAEWDQDAEMWGVWFEDGSYMRFTRKQGKAMGLTHGPDFSALPPGTVVRSERNRHEDTKGADGRWRGPNSVDGRRVPEGAPYTVIHQPSVAVLAPNPDEHSAEYAPWALIVPSGDIAEVLSEEEARDWGFSIEEVS